MTKYRIRPDHRGVWHVTVGPPRSFWYFGDPLGMRDALERYDAARRVCAQMNEIATYGRRGPGSTLAGPRGAAGAVQRRRAPAQPVDSAGEHAGRPGRNAAGYPRGAWR